MPVLLLPGNHERGQLPHPLLALHRNLHLFDRPRTVVLEAGGVRVAFAGFPYQRDAGWSPIWSFAACGRSRRGT